MSTARTAPVNLSNLYIYLSHSEFSGALKLALWLLFSLSTALESVLISNPRRKGPGQLLSLNLCRRPKGKLRPKGL